VKRRRVHKDILLGCWATTTPTTRSLAHVLAVDEDDDDDAKRRIKMQQM
jgi:hypothetical protein